MNTIKISVEVVTKTPAPRAVNGPALVKLIRECARNNDLDAALLPVMELLDFEDMGGSAELFFEKPLENAGGGIRKGWADLPYEYRADLLAEYVAYELAQWVSFARLTA